MRITIALPLYQTRPIGGYHVHYSYANLLTARGHQVTVVFPRWMFPTSSLIGRIVTPFWAMNNRLRNRPLIPSFPLRPDVRVQFLPDLGSSLPRADVLIATSWETAEAMQHAAADRGRKYYVVYDYEFWKTSETDIRQRMAETYRAEYTIIATSGIVKEMVEECGGQSAALIPCGIDFDAFGMDVPPERRRPLSLGVPLRHESFKGTADVIAAADRLRSIYGDRLEVTAFGGRDTPAPPWFERLERPSQSELRRFYNEIAVFVMPSHFEGFGLPGAEAMACGAALVTTFNGGSADYAIPESTALVVPPQQPEALAEAVHRLFKDDALRIRLAEAGRRQVQEFNWERSADALDRLLTAG